MSMHNYGDPPENFDLFRARLSRSPKNIGIYTVRTATYDFL